MTSIRPFEPADIFKFGPMYIHMGNKSNAVELLLKYYFTYPDYCIVAAHHTGEIMGYAAGSERQDPLLRIPVKLFAYLGTFCVARKFQMRQSVNVELSRALEKAAIYRNRPYMRVILYHDCPRLLRLQQGMGYVRGNILEDFFFRNGRYVHGVEMTKWFPEVTLQDWYITAERLAGQYGQDALEHARQQLALQQINQGGQGNGQNR